MPAERKVDENKRSAERVNRNGILSQMRQTHLFCRALVNPKSLLRAAIINSNIDVKGKYGVA